MQKILDVIAYAGAAIFVLAMVRFAFYPGPATLAIIVEQSNWLDQGLFYAGIIGVLVFWIMMMLDSFRNKELRNGAAWGFALLFFNWGAAFVYFFLHYLPRHKQHAQDMPSEKP